MYRCCLSGPLLSILGLHLGAKPLGHMVNLHELTLPPATSEGANLSTSLPTPVIFLNYFYFFIGATLVGMKQSLIAVLIYISLMTNDAMHLFVYLFSSCVSCLEKSLIEPFAHV